MITTASSGDNPAYRASTRNLRSLLFIRSLALLGQAVVFAYMLNRGAPDLAILGAGVCLLSLSLFTAASFWRLSRHWPVTDIEFLLQLLVDVAGWTTLMYFCGGANNPFISYYLVPLVIAAAVLPWSYTWLITGVSLAAYSLLLYFYVPLPLFSPHIAAHGAVVNTHVLGMWVNFLVSASLITFFVVRMAAALRLQEAAVAEQREDNLRNEQILAVAGVAAGTAHELATPLSTMTVLVEELLEEAPLDSQRRRDCELLEDQLGRCRRILQNLSKTAEQAQAGPPRPRRVDEYLREVLAQWNLLRPEASYSLQLVGEQAIPQLAVESGLTQALENVLNNAANACPLDICVRVGWDEHWVQIQVADRGPGVPLAVMEQIGKPQLVMSKSGLGLGLLLSHATVNRYGGSLELANRSEGGAVATLKLPLQASPRSAK